MSEKKQHDNKKKTEDENIAEQEAVETLHESEEVSEELEQEEDKVASLEAALEKEKKEYLFLMAEFDNFRKRTVKEKAEIIKNAAGQVMKGLLPIVDDFERGLEATKDTCRARGHGTDI